MLAPRPSSPRASLISGLTLTLAVALGWLAPAPSARAWQAPPTAKEKAKKADEKKAEKKEAAAVDLNSAPLEELTTLPGVGEAFARKIIDTRPHKSVEDLATHGIPARTVEGLKALAVARPVPVAVDLNHDPLVRIETLPGVGPALAKELVAGRPYAGYDDLARLKGFGPAKIDSLKGRVKFGKGESAAAEKRDEARVEAKKQEARAEATREREKEEARPSREPGRPGAKVHLNTASLEELDALPGIGPVRAQAIVDARPFAKIEDIMKIKGIKQVEFDKIKDQITVAK